MNAPFLFATAGPRPICSGCPKKIVNYGRGNFNPSCRGPLTAFDYRKMRNELDKSIWKDLARMRSRTIQLRLPRAADRRWIKARVISLQRRHAALKQDEEKCGFTMAGLEKLMTLKYYWVDKASQSLAQKLRAR